MRAALTALMLTFATQAGAECGKLCDDDWWKTATTADLQAELSGGADIMARNEDGETPLHYAARYGPPANIQALKAAGADGKAKGKTVKSRGIWPKKTINSKAQKATGR